MNELREIIRTTEAELADIEKEIVHLKHEYEAAQKELDDEFEGFLKQYKV